MTTDFVRRAGIWSAILAAIGILVGVDPPGPDSLVLVIFLLAACVGLLVLVARLRSLWVKGVCGVCVVVLAMAAGIVEVNRYYGYYTSWSAMVDDLSGKPVDLGGPEARPVEVIGHVQDRPGAVISISLPGARSHITRNGLVYLPPQYGQPRYAHVRFPVIELLHGSPGHPDDWVYALRIQTVLDTLIARHLMGPVVAVMPAFNDGNSYEECLNTRDYADDTYISTDVPADIRQRYRVSRDPAEWGISGYSSGGYCTANLALRHRADYGAAAVIDGYYRATDGPAAADLDDDPAAEAANSPLTLARRLPADATPMPALWVGAGSGNRYDLDSARAFVAALKGIEQVTFVDEPGAGHNFYAWAGLIPSALTWLWQQIASPDLRREFPVAGSPRMVYVPPHLRPREPPPSFRGSILALEHEQATGRQRSAGTPEHRPSRS